MMYDWMILWFLCKSAKCWVDGRAMYTMSSMLAHQILLSYFTYCFTCLCHRAVLYLVAKLYHEFSWVHKQVISLFVFQVWTWCPEVNKLSPSRVPHMLQNFVLYFCFQFFCTRPYQNLLPILATMQLNQSGLVRDWVILCKWWLMCLWVSRDKV